MQAYNKLAVALVGLIVLLANKHFGVDLAGTEAALVDIVVALLTVFGIYQVPNRKETSDGSGS